MSFDPINWIRSRSREEWQQLFVDRWSDGRIWVKDNGEKAALVAFMLGIVLVVFYKLVIGLLAISIVVVFIGWNIALPATEVAKNPESEAASKEPGFRTREHPPEEPPVI